jgi:hypothetical protein
MIRTIIGIILLLAPFLLVIRFKDKLKGFFYVFSFLIFFHLILGLVTQFFGIFNYPTILVVNCLVFFGVVFKTRFKKLKKIRIQKIDWVFVFLFIILFIQFWSVHYNYTGDVTTIVQGYNPVENMKYSYPYFSDEWVAVSMIDYSINSGKLALVNPLWYDNFFPNLELAFHCFLSEIVLLLDLRVLTQYSILSLFSGIIICLLGYFILRKKDVGKLSSAVACIGVSYIVNGANLPGIWYLMPITLGIISMLLGFLFMGFKDKKMPIILAFLVLIFYPPLFIFYTASLVFYFIFLDISKKKKFKYLGIYFSISIVVALLLFFVLLLNMGFSESLTYLFNKFFYSTHTIGHIPDFAIYKVIPLFILAFSILGLRYWKKQLWLLVPIILGAGYWIIYSFVLWRFVIGYERVVFLTSLMIVILSGFGLEYFVLRLKKYGFFRRYHIFKIVLILLLVVFFILSFSYTGRDNWKDLKLYSVESDKYVLPAAPANKYLHESDLEIFQNIREKNFISLPWKGLVIGVSTGNYPLETKPSTITNSFVNYREFISLDCSEKLEIVRRYEVDYIYLSRFECPNFKLQDISAEGLHLYKFENL